MLCTRFIWITNSCYHRRVWTADLLHTMSLPNPMGFAVQTLLWSLEFVIQINLEHNTVAVWNLARSWSISSILSILRNLDPFPQIFGQIKEWLVIELGLARRSVQIYEKISFFSSFWQFWLFSPKFWASDGVAYITIAWNIKSATCNVVRNYFYFVLWLIWAGRSVSNYGKWSFFSIFSRLGTFPHVFGKGKEWLMLDVHGTKMPPVVPCPMDFSSLPDQGQQGGIL